MPVCFEKGMGGKPGTVSLIMKEEKDVKGGKESLAKRRICKMKGKKMLSEKCDTEFPYVTWHKAIKDRHFRVILGTVCLYV